MERYVRKIISEHGSHETFGNIITYQVSPDDIAKVCENLYFEQRLALKTVTAFDEGTNIFKIMYVFGIPKENIFLAPYIRLENAASFPSLANSIHEITNYERKINTFFGISPVGHIDPRPILLHENWPADQHPLRKGFKWDHRPAETKGSYKFAEVQGEGIYEIPVGPVHAGIIEPGHFRFSVAGEEIVNLEPRLGYAHKGSEKLFEILPLADKIRLSERISGDSSFSHSLAFCQALELLAGIKIPGKADWLRVIFAELERLANHFGDIGFIMLDTGYSFGGSNGTRLREMIMQWNEKLTGSRFLRGVNAIGGVTKDIAPEIKALLIQDLEKIEKDFMEVIAIAGGSNSLFDRLEKTGQLDPTIAKDHGVVGVPARAVGIKVDVRTDYPYAAYGKLPFKVAHEETGDVQARFKVRIAEVYSSIKIIREALKNLDENGKIQVSEAMRFNKNSCAISMVEGWRGEIFYLVATDQDGNISRVDVRDPSFLNWPVLEHTGKGNVVPDFPLINKSFNLSYSGNDL